MQDPKTWAGGVQEGLSAAEREREALIESWKER
jgi:hypothetical protein